MELIKGTRVKDELDTATTEKIIWLCQEIGSTIAKLHSNGIVQDDPTTSN